MSKCLRCQNTFDDEQTVELSSTSGGSSYGPYCFSCWQEIRICDSCNTAFDKSDVNIVDGECICNTCLNSTSRCDDCSKVKDPLFKLWEGKMVCAYCIQRYFLCETCGIYHPKSASIHHDRHTQLEYSGLFKAVKATISENTCVSCFVKMRSKRHKKHIVFTCLHCGDLSNSVNENKLHYCHNCIKNVHFCIECNQYAYNPWLTNIIGVRGYKDRAAHICRPCLEGKYKDCVFCNEYVRIGDFNHEHSACNSCLTMLSLCQHCGNLSKGFYIVGSIPVCGSCYSHRRTCSVCDIQILKTYTYSCSDDVFCRGCASKKLLGRTESYSYKPYPIMHGSKGDLHMGFENEISVKAGEDIGVNIAKVLGNYTEHQVYIKSDSSVYHGFEVVSHPFTLEAFKELDWEYIFTSDTIEDDSCGLHVHLSRKSFTPYHLYKFLYFIHNNKEFITSIAGRGATNYSKEIGQDLRGMARGKRKGKLNGSRYDREAGYSSSDPAFDRHTKVNLSGKDTVELRFFKGCGNAYKLHYRIEFCHALFIFSRDNNKDMLSPDCFESFVEKENKRYQYLNDFINTKVSEVVVEAVPYAQGVAETATTNTFQSYNVSVH